MTNTLFYVFWCLRMFLNDPSYSKVIPRHLSLVFFHLFFGGNFLHYVPAHICNYVEDSSDLLTQHLHKLFLNFFLSMLFVMCTLFLFLFYGQILSRSNIIGLTTTELFHHKTWDDVTNRNSNAQTLICYGAVSELSARVIIINLLMLSHLHLFCVIIVRKIWSRKIVHIPGKQCLLLFLCSKFILFVNVYLSLVNTLVVHGWIPDSEAVCLAENEGCFS